MGEGPQRPRDERGRFVSERDVPRYCVTVWSVLDGDMVEKLWEASEAELDEIERRYEDDPFTEIQTEHMS